MCQSRSLFAVVTTLQLALLGVADAAPPFRFAGAHAAYSIGGAVAKEGPALRHSLEVGVHVGWLDRHPGPMGSNSSGWMVGPAALVGFGGAPRYLIGEVGYGWNQVIAGLSLLGGPAFVVDPRFAGGASLRFAADFVLLQASVRLLAVGGAGASAFQACFSIGLGRM